MSWMRRHRAATALAVVVVAVLATVTAFALRSDGYQSRHVDLNDGGVWVTSDKDGLFGRLNKPAAALDLALNPAGGAQPEYRLDVRQQDSAVVAWDKNSGRLIPVDVAEGQLLTDQEVPVSDTEQVQLNGGTLAVLDPAKNQVWATHVDLVNGIESLAAVDPSAKPVIKFGAVAVAGSSAHTASMAVGDDGSVYAATTAGQVAVVHPKGSKFTKESQHKLTEPLKSVQVTAVGDSMVVFDPVSGTVELPGDQQAMVKVDPDARIQDPSASGSRVAIATKTQLFAVPLTGGDAVTLFDGGSGAPAAPEQFEGCIHSAWAGRPGVYARACGNDQGKQLALPHEGNLVSPVFRINRGNILLNDLSLGSVYDLDTLQEVDNWSSVKPPPIVKVSKKSRNNNSNNAARNLPPKARSDSYGARPDRTTTLHVLDNDSDPTGAILAVTRVYGLDQPKAGVTVSPDGQSVQFRLPQNVAAVHFRYTVDDGKAMTANASVSVQARGDAENKAPGTRLGFKQTVFTVSSGGTLDLPVLDDWRDFDGDPLVLTSATATSGRVTTSPDGRLNYVAPANGGNETITYYVSDGRADPVAHRVPITVLGPTAANTAPPVAEPDTAHGQVGHPIKIEPLANDLPGADPTNPNATLALAGTVASPAGVHVDTDLKSNVLTVTPTRHGTFSLSYNAAFGNAKFSSAKIRVDVASAPSSPQPPVAVPDTGVLYGQNPATIDVLANDFDPAGGVLVVQHAEAVESDALEVAIVSGHFLRISASDSDLNPNPQVVKYTITDGISAPVDGEVTVTQVDPPDDDTPLAVDDYATVRSGDSGLIPVLDNDIDPTGAPLALLDDVTGAPNPGQLVTTTVDGAKAGAGNAYVSDKQVRYAAPVVRRETTNTISYVVTNPAGGRATGIVHVTVEPPPSAANPDAAPTPQQLTSRDVSGDTISIKIPNSGIDPDGDSTTVVGITAAPTLGRVVTIGATSITYEAFPTESGTDHIGYIVTDPFGKTGTSTISVGVGAASDPQPPVAVDDSLAAAPGSKLRVDALANDVIAPDDNATVKPLSSTNPELPTGTKLRSPLGPVQITASPTDGRSTTVLYSLSDGIGDPSTAAITLHSQRGYVPAPIALDAVATPKPKATSVTVDVLSKDSDPQQLPLTVSDVSDPAAKIVGSKVTLPVLSRPQNVLYEIRNSQGGTAAAVIHVPARGVGLPTARLNKLIAVDRNSSTTIDIADYAVDPAGKRLRLTTTAHLSAAPADGLTVTGTDTTHLKVTSTNGYIGPAAVTFQVSNAKTLSDPDAQLALITVPVQVGPNTPVVRCPTAPIKVVEGGPDNTLNVLALCHVWTADSSSRSKLRFDASWKSQPHDVQILGSGTGEIGLRAKGAASPGDSGTLRITVAGSQATPSSINVTVVKLGKPSLRAIQIDGVKAGSSATRNVGGYLSSPLRDPQPTAVRLVRTGGPAAKATTNGGQFTITPDRDVHGQIRFSLVASDVANKSRSDRQVTGTVTLNVLNVPDAPGAPQAGRTVLSRTVVLSWPTPAANGAPIDGYQVQWPGGTQSCAASPCRITGLTNGQEYAFTVRAHNAVGYGKPSPALSPKAKPDKLPGSVGSVTTSKPQDHTLTVSWTAAQNEGSAIKTYRVSWSGGGSRVVPGTARSVQATGLTNDNVYTFTVVAVNDLGAGPPANTKGQSAGTPPVPGGVAVAYADAVGTDTRTVNVTWNASDPNGRGPTTYTVSRDSTVVCRNTQQTSCTDTPATGHTYTYGVTAQNAVGHRSQPGTAMIVVAGTPDQPTGMSAKHTNTDGQLEVHYTVPNPHGQQSTIKCTYNGGDCGSWAPDGATGAAVSHVVSSLPSDADVTVTLTDCNEQQCGPPGSAGAHTDGPPHQPASISCSLSGGTKITWNWNPPSPVNDQNVNNYRISLDGGGESGVSGTSYSKTFSQDGHSHNLQVRSVDPRGEASSGTVNTSCKTDDPPDPPAVEVTPGTYGTHGDCSGGCHDVHVHLSHFTPGSSVTFYRTWSPATDEGPEYHSAVTIGSDGTWTGDFGYYGGGSSGGHGPGTVSIYVTTGSKPSDSCSSNWHTPDDYSCD